MKIKIVEKKQILLGIFTCVYIYFVFVISNPVLLFIEKSIFGYEPIKSEILDIIPPANVLILSLLIYLSAVIILYLILIKIIKFK